MKHVLLVVRPFGPYAVGELISEAREMRKTSAGAHAHDVIRVVAPMAASEKQEEI